MRQNRYARRKKFYFKKPWSIAQAQSTFWFFDTPKHALMHSLTHTIICTHWNTKMAQMLTDDKKMFFEDNVLTSQTCFVRQFNNNKKWECDTKLQTTNQPEYSNLHFETLNRAVKMFLTLHPKISCLSLPSHFHLLWCLQSTFNALSNCANHFQTKPIVPEILSIWRGNPAMCIKEKSSLVYRYQITSRTVQTTIISGTNFLRNDTVCLKSTPASV